MFLNVVGCKYVENYILRVKFDNGEELDVDLANELDGEIFEPLKSLDYFREFKISTETNTIEWPNGADFAPEFLYEYGKVRV